MPPILLGLEPTRSLGFGLQHMCPQGFQANMSSPSSESQLKRMSEAQGRSGWANLAFASSAPREPSICGGPPNHGHSGRTHQVGSMVGDLEQQKRCCSG
eukprot:jgi/Botrbrau1/8110/Bobra.0308s0005.1